MAGIDQAALAATVGQLKSELANEPLDLASRVASQMVLERLFARIPQMLGGSADLTGSNNTRAPDMGTFSASDHAGRYFHYGIREHGMAAAMNGLTLHGGVVPYGRAFLVFSDYCRPSIRLSALMGQQVIYVLTRGSIALGEYGPTHQPVEHLAALRAIPNLNVFRSADMVETAECWAAALLDAGTPSILALTRQTLPQLRKDHSRENLCERGGYVLRKSADAVATLIATGSEVGLAVEAADQLIDQNIPVRVVSLPNLHSIRRKFSVTCRGSPSKPGWRWGGANGCARGTSLSA